MAKLIGTLKVLLPDLSTKWLSTPVMESDWRGHVYKTKKMSKSNIDDWWAGDVNKMGKKMAHYTTG